jgi:GTP-binding protein YchF
MSLNSGIVGLPNVGKSTLFNALTSSQNAQVANYPFCTIEPNFGTVIIPDKRLDNLVKIYNPKKTVPSTIEFVDIAGLVKNASKGEGLGNQFLAHIRLVDAIIHIVRCFEDDNVTHVSSEINPENDIDVVEIELILKDLDTLNKRIDRVAKNVRVGEKKLQHELDLLKGLKEHLNKLRLARYFIGDLDEEEKAIVKDMYLLTDKPVLYVANVDDHSLEGNKYSDEVKRIAEKEKEEFLIMSVEMESEIAQIETPDERQIFLDELGLKEPGLNKLIREAYRLLNLITFFTVSEKEVHSWTIHKGIKCQQAAGVIHTDFEKGFIRAEVMKYEDLIQWGSEHNVKEKGLLHIEGKDYVVEDGDIMYYRFNV